MSPLRALPLLLVLGACAAPGLQDPVEPDPFAPIDPQTDERRPVSEVPS